MNQERVEKRRAAGIVMALAAAFGDIDKSWFDALSKTEEEANAMFERHKALEHMKQNSGNFF